VKNETNMVGIIKIMNINKPIILDSQIHLSNDEIKAREELLTLNKHSPILDNEILQNLPLFIHKGTLGRILFLDKLYLKILNTPGIIMEFGVRWGRDLAIFSALRNIYEPYNVTRKIVGFDTFEGFPTISQQDGDANVVQTGALSVASDYEKFLEKVLSSHEKMAPRNHLKKYELIKGDVTETLGTYLEEHPETIISLAYFDLDLYEPTKKCLELIRPHLVKNSIIGFDELVCEEFPGETQALKDAWGLNNFKIFSDPIAGQVTYLVFE